VIRQAEFLTDLIVSPTRAGRWWITKYPFVYYSAILGREIVIPEGFEFNGNSIPRPWWVISTPAEYLEAGCIHDWLYLTKEVSRWEADRVYKEALALLKLHPFRRMGRYLVLRLFGWLAYKGEYEEVSKTTSEVDCEIRTDASGSDYKS
jgi:hypothetical protein